MEIFPSTLTDTLPGPKQKLGTNEPYSPVDCDFTDELERLAVKKIPVVVRHWNEEGRLVENTGLVTDILTANKEEFLVMTSDRKIRLDHIAEIRIQN